MAEINTGLSKYFHEESLKSLGYNAVCGVDEAGRGPLAGRVYAAAVILDEENPIEGLDDSKKLSEKKRKELFKLICEKAKAYSICWCEADEIDNVNILNATLNTMKKAIESLPIKADYFIVDGNFTPKNMDIEGKAIISGDALSASISAASILAKVARDDYMYEMDKLYPEYLFAKHKGYGTKAHYIAILTHGVLPLHRKSFLKNLEEKRQKFMSSGDL